MQRVAEIDETKCALVVTSAGMTQHAVRRGFALYDVWTRSMKRKEKPIRRVAQSHMIYCAVFSLNSAINKIAAQCIYVFRVNLTVL